MRVVESSRGNCTRLRARGGDRGYGDGDEEDESDEFDDDYSFGRHYADDDEGRWDEIM